MSTKTLRKRIALVAVAALGFGMVSTVAAQAATISSITVGTIPTARVGESVTIPITINLSGAGTAGDTTVIAAKIASAPSTANGQTATSTLGDNPANAIATPVFYLGTSAAGNVPGTLVASKTKAGELALNTAVVGSVSSATSAGAIDATGDDKVAATALSVVHTAASTVTAYLTLKPDVSGSYSILISATNGTGAVSPSFSYEAGVGLSSLITVTTGGAPTSVTLTDIGGKTSISGTYGTLVRVNLKDAAGNAVGITGDESVNVTTSAGYIAKATAAGGSFTSNAPTASTTARLAKADFVNGIAYVNVLPTSTTAVVVTATGTGTLAAITASLSVSAQTTSDLTVTSFLGRDGTVVASGWDSATACTTSCSRNVAWTATSSSLAYTFADVADATTAYGHTTIKDVGGKIAGAPIGSNDLRFEKGFSITGTTATTDTYAVVTVAHSASTSQSYTATTGSLVVTVTSAEAVTTSSTGSVTPNITNVRAAAAGSVAIKTLVKSQFNSALVGTSVTVTVSGRNGTRTSETLLTDASGYVSTTITDAGTASVSDTVTFTAAGGKTGTTTITWGAYTVGTLTVTGGGTAADTYVGQSLTSISAAGAGPDGASVAITATVKDADGNLLAGVPVTFSVDKGLVRKTSTTDFTTVYTGTAGTAVTYVLGWEEGKQTITATAGGKTASDYLVWDANTASAARAVSGVASGNKVTATVKDRYGNTVKGVTVDAKTSAGYFGQGTDSTSGTTDSDGVVSFFLNGVSGSASVTLSLNKTTYPQSIDVAGKVLETAVTAASTTGTTAGTGASLSAAGVNSVVVAVEAKDLAADNAQAATDAAAEATDAANAATDAANAAAEAADAATAAAQDAADAVAALSTQVSEMVNALKKQITALTNLVIKIQKKVKA